MPKKTEVDLEAEAVRREQVAKILSTMHEDLDTESEDEEGVEEQKSVEAPSTSPTTPAALPEPTSPPSVKVEKRGKYVRSEHQLEQLKNARAKAAAARRARTAEREQEKVAMMVQETLRQRKQAKKTKARAVAGSPSPPPAAKKPKKRKVVEPQPSPMSQRYAPPEPAPTRLLNDFMYRNPFG